LLPFQPSWTCFPGPRSEEILPAVSYALAFKVIRGHDFGARGENRFGEALGGAVTFGCALFSNFTHPKNNHRANRTGGVPVLLFPQPL
jgi:hypothetical protein